MIAILVIANIRLNLSNNRKTDELSQNNERIIELEHDYSVIEQQLEETRQSVMELRNELTQTVEEPNTVLFSNFYVGDETGEVGMTSSGLTVNDFYPNEQGYLMYNGKVVIAAAHDVLGQVQEGYETHELYDELVISINGSDYEAIVLDVCGACMGGYGEDYQRYDIMTVGSVIGLKVGYVYKEDN